MGASFGSCARPGLPAFQRSSVQSLPGIKLNFRLAAVGGKPDSGECMYPTLYQNLRHLTKGMRGMPDLTFAKDLNTILDSCNFQRQRKGEGGGGRALGLTIP